MAIAPRRAVRAVALACALPVGGFALALAAVALQAPESPTVRDWLVVDAAGGLLVGVIGLVGLASALLSPAYLDGVRGSLFSEPRRERAYFVVLYLFWAALLGVPLAGNLGAAWLLVEATTAISAMLVGFSGKPRALEAAWKYLVLTSLGLASPCSASSCSGRDPRRPSRRPLLAGARQLRGRQRPGARRLSAPARGARGQDRLGAGAQLASGCALRGAAAGIGAPLGGAAARSAARRVALGAVARARRRRLLARGVLVGFGLLSLAVAVPFLWRSLAWKRLLAYSSLEHMGVLALGIGFATPLALAGVAVHLVGHALAKALGFYAATPLFDLDPRTTRRAPSGVARTQPALAAMLGVSLGSLAALPPSPLFVSEVLIVGGGFQAGRPWAAAATAFLLALGFLGLAHALLETTAGEQRRRDTGPPLRLRALGPVAIAGTVLLGALSVAALWLPGSSLVAALVRGIS